MIWKNFGYFSSYKKFRYWLIENGILIHILDFLNSFIEIYLTGNYLNYKEKDLKFSGDHYKFYVKILKEISFIILNLTNIITSEKSELISSGLFDKMMQFVFNLENLLNNNYLIK